MPSQNTDATDAPRPALDAASFRDLLDAHAEARAASAVAEREDDEEWARRSCEREDVLRGRLIVAYDALLAAAAERDALAREAARLRAALTFYADPEHWTLTKRTPGSPWVIAGAAWPDKGERARAALAPADGETEGTGDGD